MDVVSCVFIVILLGFIIFGAVTGLLRSLLHYAKGLISFILALLLCRPVASLFSNLPIVQEGQNNIYSWLCSVNPIFSTTFHPDQREAVLDALKSLYIPDFLASFLADKITPSIPLEGIELGTSVASTLMMLFLTIICFIILIIVIRLLLILIRRFIKGLLDKLPAIKTVDRVLGALLGVVFGIFIIDILCIAITGITSVPFFNDMSNWFADQMALNNPEQFRLSKFFMENNLVLKLIGMFI